MRATVRLALPFVAGVTSVMVAACGDDATTARERCGALACSPPHVTACEELEGAPCYIARVRLDMCMGQIPTCSSDYVHGEAWCAEPGWEHPLGANTSAAGLCPWANRLDAAGNCGLGAGSFPPPDDTLACPWEYNRCEAELRTLFAVCSP